MKQISALRDPSNKPAMKIVKGYIMMIALASPRAYWAIEVPIRSVIIKAHTAGTKWPLIENM
jgi:hypothetical protein